MQKHDGKNPGGHSALYIKLKSEVTAIPLPIDLSISDNITTTGNWEQIIYIPGTADHTEDRSDGPDGNVYQQRITCIINKDALALGQALFTYQNREIIAAITDHNGTTRVIGTLNEPARLTYNLVKDKSLAGGTNAYTLTITATTTEPAPYYTGTITASV